MQMIKNFVLFVCRCDCHLSVCHCSLHVSTFMSWWEWVLSIGWLRESLKANNIRSAHPPQKKNQATPMKWQSVKRECQTNIKNTRVKQSIIWTSHKKTTQLKCNLCYPTINRHCFWKVLETASGENIEAKVTCRLWQ